LFNLNFDSPFHSLHFIINNYNTRIIHIQHFLYMHKLTGEKLLFYSPQSPRSPTNELSSVGIAQMSTIQVRISLERTLNTHTSILYISYMYIRYELYAWGCDFGMACLGSYFHADIRQSTHWSIFRHYGNCAAAHKIGKKTGAQMWRKKKW
jgi:hypothetical protein